MSDLKTVATFANSQEAAVAQMALSEIGIQSFVCDGELVAMDWFYRNAIGYVKLQTRDDQVEAARAALGAWRDQLQANRQAAGATGRENATGEDSATCLACGAALPPDRSSCPACGWSYAKPVERPAAEAAAALPSAPAPSDVPAHGVPAGEPDEDAAELDETNASSLGFVLGLIFVGLLAMALLTRLRDFVQTQL